LLELRLLFRGSRSITGDGWPLPAHVVLRVVLRPRAWADANDLSPDTAGVVGLRRSILLSGCRLLRFSPVYVAGRRHARIKLAPRRARQRLSGRPNQSAWYPGRLSRTNPLSPVRFSLVSAARTLSRCRTDTALRRSDASPEVFCPLQRLPAAMRCPGRPSLRTIPLRRYSPACDPRVPWNSVGPSPTDGVLAVFRFSDAMRLCSMWGLASVALIATFRAA